MQREDLAPIAKVIAETVKMQTAPLLERLAAVEARAVVHGQDGRDGKDAPAVDLAALAVLAAALIPTPKDGQDGINGTNAPELDIEQVAIRAAALVAPSKDGLDGKDGKDGVIADSVLEEFRTRLTCLETADPDEIPAADVVAAVESEFRKELDVLVKASPRLQKRIVRDASGRIEAVVDAPVGDL